MIIFVYNYKCLRGNQRTIDKVINSLKEIYKNIICVNDIALSDLNYNKINILIIGGGDGSINKILNKINSTNIRPNITYGLIPLGTANDICHNLNINNINRALKVLKENKRNKYQLFKVNDDYMMYAYAEGSIACLCDAHKCKKRLMRKWIYPFEGIKYLLNKKKIICIKINDKIIVEKIIALIVVRSNYLGGFKISKNDSIDNINNSKVIIIKNIKDLINLFIFRSSNNIEFDKYVDIYTSNNYYIDGEFNQAKRSFKKITVNKEFIDIIS